MVNVNRYQLMLTYDEVEFIEGRSKVDPEPKRVELDEHLQREDRIKYVFFIYCLHVHIVKIT